MVVGFLASRPGRWLRIVTGAGMVLGGLASGSSRGAKVSLLGLGPLVAATLDMVMVAPLFGLPMRGEELRRQLGVPDEDGRLLMDGNPRATQSPSTLLH